jgi:hypothetical protein
MLKAMAPTGDRKKLGALQQIMEEMCGNYENIVFRFEQENTALGAQVISLQEMYNDVVHASPPTITIMEQELNNYIASSRAAAGLSPLAYAPPTPPRSGAGGGNPAGGYQPPPPAQSTPHAARLGAGGSPPGGPGGGGGDGSGGGGTDYSDSF